MVSTQNPSLAATVTPVTLEIVLTALELAAHRTPQIPIDRITPDRSELQAICSASPRSPTPIPPQSAITAVKQYWLEKRQRANDHFPLIPELQAWPLESQRLDHLPYWSREVEVLEWTHHNPPNLVLPPPHSMGTPVASSTPPTKGSIPQAGVEGMTAGEIVETEEAIKSMKYFIDLTVTLLSEVVKREKLRLEQTQQTVYELRCIRSALCPMTTMVHGNTSCGSSMSHTNTNEQNGDKIIEDDGGVLCAFKGDDDHIIDISATHFPSNTLMLHDSDPGEEMQTDEEREASHLICQTAKNGEQYDSRNGPLAAADLRLSMIQRCLKR